MKWTYRNYLEYSWINVNVFLCFCHEGLPCAAACVRCLARRSRGTYWIGFKRSCPFLSSWLFGAELLKLLFGPYMGVPHSRQSWSALRSAPKLASSPACFSHPAISPGIEPVVEFLLPSAIPSLQLLPFDSLTLAVSKPYSVVQQDSSWFSQTWSLQGQTPSAAANRAAPVLLGVVALDVCGVSGALDLGQEQSASKRFFGFLNTIWLWLT